MYQSNFCKLLVCILFITFMYQNDFCNINHCNDSAPDWDLDWTIQSYLILSCTHEIFTIVSTIPHLPIIHHSIHHTTSAHILKVQITLIKIFYGGNTIYTLIFCCCQKAYDFSSDIARDELEKLVGHLNRSVLEPTLHMEGQVILIKQRKSVSQAILICSLSCPYL